MRKREGQRKQTRGFIPELVEGRGPLEDKMDPRVKPVGDGLSTSRSSEISPALRFPFRNICDNIWTALPEVLELMIAHLCASNVKGLWESRIGGVRGDR